MMNPANHPLPRMRDVLVEQIRTTGLALRGPAAALAALAALATMLFAVEIIGEGDVVSFHPERWLVPGLLGFLLPVAVWQGEERFGAGFLWTLPVDRRLHALIKVFAGWVWLMGAVALFLLWLLGFTFISGSDEAASPLLWLTPVTGATATYLVSSALALGVTLRGLIGTLIVGFLAIFIVGLTGDATNSEWLIFAPSRLIRSVIYEPYGLATLLSASSELPGIPAPRSTEEMIEASQRTADLGRWAIATLLWTCGGFLGLWLAASRHRERRSP